MTLFHFRTPSQVWDRNLPSTLNHRGNSRPVMREAGVDEAAIRAAQRLGKTCGILCPKGYRFSDASDTFIAQTKPRHRTGLCRYQA